MVDRYSTNQFYNFTNYEEAIKGGPTDIGTDDNPAFIWPSNQQRNAVAGSTIPMQRGYMRMITEGYGIGEDIKKLAQRRFHFQFNPDVLMRSVENTQGTQYWMNQDPAQFINPIPGNANFAFEFILNREAEVATRQYRRGYKGNVVKARSGKTVLPGDTLVESVTDAALRRSGGPNTETTVSPGVYNQESVVDIGVLADLFVFDQIIGQGMNMGVLKLFKDRATAAADEYNRKVEKDQTADSEDKTTEAPTIVVDDLKNFLTGNISNSAFLVSQPVRIVFSSLFMVEGFINSTSVVFNKFNPAMVPTQCTVSVQMSAMYIGFAVKNTFLTATLRESLVSNSTTVSANDEAVAESQALIELSRDLFKSINDGVTNRGYSDNDTTLYIRDLLEKGNESGVTKLRIEVLATDLLRRYIKDGLVTEVTGLIDLILVYKGVNGVQSANTDYAVGEEVYSVQSSYETVKRDDDEGAKPTFTFAKKLSTANKRWDQNDNAEYEVGATITFTLVTNIQDLTCKQVGKVKQTYKYGEGVSGADFSLHVEA